MLQRGRERAVARCVGASVTLRHRPPSRDETGAPAARDPPPAALASVEKQNARAGGNAILGVGWRMLREWRRGEGRRICSLCRAGALALTRTAAGWITWRGGV